MKLGELVEKIQEDVLSNQIVLVQEKIDKYFNEDRFRKLDAEERNRQIISTKAGLAFALKKALKLQPYQYKGAEAQIDKVLAKVFRGLVNRLDYSIVQTSRPGRPTGHTPSGNPPMVKKTKSWSFSAETWEWLESQPNQSETIRQAIALIRQQSR